MAFSKIAGLEVMPAQAVFVDQALQFAAGEQVAADVVQPDGLAEILKLVRGLVAFAVSSVPTGFITIS